MDEILLGLGLAAIITTVIMLPVIAANFDLDAIPYAISLATKVRRSGAWSQTRGKTYLMKKLKPIGEKQVVPSDSHMSENLFIILFARSAPRIFRSASLFLKPEYAKEKDQLIRMFQYALAVVDKYPLPREAKDVLLRQCLCAFSEHVPHGTKIDLETSAITFNGFVINGLEKEASHTMNIRFTDTRATEGRDQKYDIPCVGALHYSTAYTKVSWILLREYQYVPHFCNPEAS